MTIFLIPARAGSKRLPGKNKRPFCGIPLWKWSVLTATRFIREPRMVQWRMSKPDKIIVSTDDEEILCHPWAERRPDHLCQDDSSSLDLVNYIFEQHGSESPIILLQPTSPTRSDETVARVRYAVHAGVAFSSRDGVKPDGQAYKFCNPSMDMKELMSHGTAVCIEHGHDIDTIDDFNEAEAWAMQRPYFQMMREIARNQ